MDATEGTPLGPKWNREYRLRTGDTLRIDQLVLDELTIEDIIAITVKHALNNPGHGINCACMDNLIRHVRGVIRSATDADNELDQAFIRRRVAYVLAAAVDRINY